MGEMTKAEAVRLLRAENPGAKAADVAVYADAFLEHRAAQANIAQHGAIVLHPRTGAPIANPYLVVRDRAVALMRKFRLRTDRLWTADGR